MSHSFYVFKKCAKITAFPQSLRLLRETAVVDIGATFTAHSITNDILAVHRITEADAVASLHEIWRSLQFMLLNKEKLKNIFIMVFRWHQSKHTESPRKSKKNKIKLYVLYGKVTEPCIYMTKYRIKMWHFKAEKNGGLE